MVHANLRYGSDGRTINEICCVELTTMVGLADNNVDAFFNERVERQDGQHLEKPRGLGIGWQRVRVERQAPVYFKETPGEEIHW